MATARKNASKAEQLRISQIGDFRARMGGVMELPSGLVVKVRNPGGLTAFIANGTIPNSLLKIVQDTLNKGDTKDTTGKVVELTKDVESLSDMLRLFDIIASQVIKEPQVRLAPTQDDVDRFNILNPATPVETPEELRLEDQYLYTDEIDEIDKQFLFQWVTGGTRDLETFRKQYESNVAAVSAEQGSEGNTELDVGADAG